MKKTATILASVAGAALMAAAWGAGYVAGKGSPPDYWWSWSADLNSSTACLAAVKRYIGEQGKTPVFPRPWEHALRFTGPDVQVAGIVELVDQSGTASPEHAYTCTVRANGEVEWDLVEVDAARAVAPLPELEGIPFRPFDGRHQAGAP